MKEARQEIHQITYNGSLYYFSIIEKQNDSGIMFNDRLFFLQHQKCIGYLSQIKFDHPSQINFQKAKHIVPLQLLKSFVINERQLHIKLIQPQGNRKLEKDWILRMSNPLLVKKWYDKLQKKPPTPKRQPSESPKKLTSETEKKVIPKTQSVAASQSPQIKKQEVKETESKISPSKKSLQITRSESFTYMLDPRLKPQKIEAGVGTPRNIDEKVAKNEKETKQIGTVMSQKAQSIAPVKSKKGQPNSDKKQDPQAILKSQKPLSNKLQPEEKPQQKISQKPQQKRQSRPQQKPQQKIQEKVAQNRKQQSQNNLIPQNRPKTKTQKGKLPDKQANQHNESKEPINDGLTDRSIAQPQNKSIRSEPNNRKIEPFKFNRKDRVEPKQQKSQHLQNKPSQSQFFKKQNPNSSKDSQQQSILKASGIKSIKRVRQLRKDEIKNQEPYNKYQKKQQQQYSPLQTQKNGNNLGLSNKRYLSEQQFNKLNTSTPIPHDKSLSNRSNEAKASFEKTTPPPYNINNQKYMSPRLPQKIQTPRQSRYSNVKNSIMEVNQSSNQSQQLHKIIQEQYSSIKIKQDSNQPIKQLETWTYKYILYDDQMFKQFQAFSLDLLQDLIEDMRLPPRAQRFKLNFIRNNIYYYQIQDVQVKIASIKIQEVESERQRKAQQKVCNKSSVKILQNEFNNFHLLYQHFDYDSKLKVPLVCLCEINGFIGLFKILSKSVQKQIRIRQIEPYINFLKDKTKINNNFYHNHNKNIIQLDENYYNSIGQSIHKRKFNCYFIQEIDEFLLQDTATQQNQNTALLRKELIYKYANQAATPENTIKSKHISKLYDKIGKESQKNSKNIFKAISQVVLEIDCLNICFYNSQELSTYLHSKGVNLRYLGHIYEHLKTPFQKKTIMSQMAARSCKSLFRKTLQDIILEDQSISSQLIKIKSCDFLNCVTSNTFQTAAMWKVLSTHSVKYFGVGLNFQEIHKGYFLVSLIHNCRVDILWQRINPQDVFKQNLLFTDKNMLGLKPVTKIYEPFHNQGYKNSIRILEEPHSEEGLSYFVNLINQYGEIPYSGLVSQIKSYLSLFISPIRMKEGIIKNLELYSNSDKAGPSKIYFDLLLMEIKWFLKYKQKQNYIKKCDQFIRIASKYYGEFHPIFSQLYDIFSSFHLNNLEYEDSITFAKSSLVNILKVCGTAHEKTSQSYYNLALCFIKSGKKDQAFSHMKKAKQIFENNGKSDSIPYAIISLKLALIYLNQDIPQQCLKSALIALQILQKQPQNIYEDELIDSYEMIARCYQTIQQKGKIKEIADKCQEKIKSITNPHNLERILKIIIYPFLSQISPENAAIYIDLINQLSLQKTEQLYNKSFQNLQIRIKEQGLMTTLRDYVQNISQIDNYIRQANLLSGWQSFKQTYPRQTINDFVAFTEELIIFLGEGFISGSLREAL